MTTDREILLEIDSAFAGRTRPEHFTNYHHCEECAEHDELLRQRNRDSLSLSDVGNPGWDPVCFISPEGFAYYLPAFARIALAAETESEDSYVPQLLFHLASDGPRHARVLACGAAERKAVAALLQHIAESRAALLDHLSCTDQLFEALGYWEQESEA